jgi:hypothetical protein
MMNKELVEAALETTLATGVAMERRLFHSLFAFDDHISNHRAYTSHAGRSRLTLSII